MNKEKVHPNSMLGLAQASMFRHIKKLLKDMIDGIIEMSTEFFPTLFLLLFYIFTLLCPPLWFILAFFRKRWYKNAIKNHTKGLNDL